MQKTAQSQKEKNPFQLLIMAAIQLQLVHRKYFFNILLKIKLYFLGMSIITFLRISKRALSGVHSSSEISKKPHLHRYFNPSATRGILNDAWWSFLIFSLFKCALIKTYKITFIFSILWINFDHTYLLIQIFHTES